MLVCFIESGSCTDHKLQCLILRSQLTNSKDTNYLYSCRNQNLAVLLLMSLSAHLKNMFSLLFFFTVPMYAFPILRFLCENIFFYGILWPRQWSLNKFEPFRFYRLEIRYFLLFLVCVRERQTLIFKAVSCFVPSHTSATLTTVLSGQFEQTYCRWEAHTGVTTLAVSSKCGKRLWILYHYQWPEYKIRIAFPWNFGICWLVLLEVKLNETETAVLCCCL